MPAVRWCAAAGLRGVLRMPGCPVRPAGAGPNAPLFVREAHASEPMLSCAQATEAAREVPGYLEVDHDKGVGKFVRGPKFEEVPYPAQMEPNLIIEFYSR